MSNELVQARNQVRLALLIMVNRAKRLAEKRSKMSRHYNRVQHTNILIDLLQELLGVMSQDPDEWDNEPDKVPF